MAPWPVSSIWFCSFLIFKARGILPSSLKGYMAGIRYGQVLEGYNWTLSSDVRVRAVLRWIRRRYPAKRQRKKVAVSISLLRSIFPLLTGWPDASVMSYPDILFVTASLLGVLAFLRGGEFLVYPGSSRPLLRFCDIDVRMVGGRPAVIVSITQPKTRWWLDEVSVPCFANPTDASFCPLRWWVALGSRRPPAAVAAFSCADSSPLARDMLVSRTAALMAEAKIAFVDEVGSPMPVCAASWRAGGVRSAIDAGVSEAVIMAFGRWKSLAWHHYLLHSTHDLFSAALAMSSCRVPLAPGHSGLVVGVCDTIGSFVEDVAAVVLQVAEVQSVVSASSAIIAAPSRPVRKRTRPARFLH